MHNSVMKVKLKLLSKLLITFHVTCTFPLHFKLFLFPHPPAIPSSCAFPLCLLLYLKYSEWEGVPPSLIYCSFSLVPLFYLYQSVFLICCGLGVAPQTTGTLISVRQGWLITHPDTGSDQGHSSDWGLQL